MSSVYGYFLLFALLLAVQYYRLMRYKERVQESFVKSGNMPRFMAVRSNFAFIARAVCIVASWVLLTSGLTKLAETKSSIELAQEMPQAAFAYPKVDEIAFILDVSASMGATDTSDGTSRLSKAKELIESICESLGGINASLVAFAGNAKTVVPDTMDYLYFRILMDATTLNDVGEAGTNLLAMIDAVKAKYVDSPFKKTVRVVLLTDGEDTGFLDMSDESKKQAETVLLEHIASTISSRLDWEVVGLGTVQGAIVPNVSFNGRQVVSSMQKGLLERMAEAGGGHFYQEHEVALTQISDGLLADVAGHAEAKEDRPSSIAPRAPGGVMLDIASALILLIFSIVMPQHQRRKVLLCAVAMLCTAGLQAEDRIDTAIQFANAGREDLALQLFSKLLQGELAPVERATILYDSSVLLARQNRYWDALTALNQIGDDLFKTVEKISPQLSVQIAYNGALYAVDFAKYEMAQLASQEKYSEDLLQHITQALSFAKNYLEKIPVSLATERLEIEEALDNTTAAVGFYTSLVALHKLDKPALLETLVGMLHEQFSLLVDIETADEAAEQSIALYMQKYKKQNIERILFSLSRLETFLQAPAKEELFAMHSFLREEIDGLRKQLLEAFAYSNPRDALHILYRLSSIVFLIQEEVAHKGVEFLLEERQDIAEERSMQNKLFSFWTDEWSFWQAFSQRYLDEKKAASDPFMAKLFSLLEAKLATTDPLIYYWKILAQDENITYQELATMLHGAKELDYSLVFRPLDPLKDRLRAEEITKAITPLEEMHPTQTARDLFDKLMTSWFYANPQKALLFLLGLLSDETTALYINPTLDSAAALGDYKLLLEWLGLFAHKGDPGILSQVYSDLVQNEAWFTAKQRRDIDFFRMLLELGWLKQILTGQTENLAGITEAVDFGLDLQKKTMSLLRYSQEARFQEGLLLMANMQKKLIDEVATGLQALPKKGPKIKKVVALIDDAKVEVKNETKELASMQRVLDDLAEASRILHSLQSESEQKESQANKELSQAMQNESLKLDPELSIRLLQEMEREDKSLQTQTIPQATGKRPW